MTLPDKDTGTETFTVEAYIVGSYNFDNDPKFVIGAENAATASILIADDPEHTDTYNNIMAIKLGNYRDDVNLADNPSNYKKKIVVTGIFEKYCGIPGLVDLTKVVLDGKEIAAGSGNNQGDYEIPADAIFSETFADSQGDFTIENVIMNDPLSYVWQHNSSYHYMAASAYVSGTTYESESWLISPAIDLTGTSNVTLNFQHAIGPQYMINVDKATMTLHFSTDYTGGAPSTATWTQVEVPHLEHHRLGLGERYGERARCHARPVQRALRLQVRHHDRIGHVGNQECVCEVIPLSTHSYREHPSPGCSLFFLSQKKAMNLFFLFRKKNIEI